MNKVVGMLGRWWMCRKGCGSVCVDEVVRKVVGVSVWVKWWVCWEGGGCVSVDKEVSVLGR